MTIYQRILSEMTPLNPEHVETLAIAIHSTLNGVPREGLAEVAALADQMGAARLAEFHASMVAA